MDVLSGQPSGQPLNSPPCCTPVCLQRPFVLLVNSAQLPPQLACKGIQVLPFQRPEQAELLRLLTLVCVAEGVGATAARAAAPGAGAGAGAGAEAGVGAEAGATTTAAAAVSGLLRPPQLDQLTELVSACARDTRASLSAAQFWWAGARSVASAGPTTYPMEGGDLHQSTAAAAPSSGLTALCMLDAAASIVGEQVHHGGGESTTVRQHGGASGGVLALAQLDVTLVRSEAAVASLWQQQGADSRLSGMRLLRNPLAHSDNGSYDTALPARPLVAIQGEKANTGEECLPLAAPLREVDEGDGDALIGVDTELPSPLCEEADVIRADVPLQGGCPPSAALTAVASEMPGTFNAAERQRQLADHHDACARVRSQHLGRVWAQVHAERQAQAKLARCVKLAASKRKSLLAQQRRRGGVQAEAEDAEQEGIETDEDAIGAAAAAADAPGVGQGVTEEDATNAAAAADAPGVGRCAAEALEPDPSGDCRGHKEAEPPCAASESDGISASDAAAVAAAVELDDDATKGLLMAAVDKEPHQGGESGALPSVSDPPPDPLSPTHMEGVIDSPPDRKPSRPEQHKRFRAKGAAEEPAVVLPYKRSRLGQCVPGGEGVSGEPTASKLSEEPEGREAPTVAVAAEDNLDGDQAARATEPLSGAQEASAPNVPGGSSWLQLLVGGSNPAPRLPPEPPALQYPEGVCASGSRPLLLAQHAELRALMMLSDVHEVLSQLSVLAAPRDTLAARSTGAGCGGVCPLAHHAVQALHRRPLPGHNAAALSTWWGRPGGGRRGDDVCEAEAMACLREPDGAHVGACLGDLLLEEQRRGARGPMSHPPHDPAAIGGTGLSVAQQAAGEAAALVLGATAAAAAATGMPGVTSDPAVPLLLMGGLPRETPLAKHGGLLRRLNDALLSTTHPLHVASLGGGGGGGAWVGTERLAATARMCALEAERECEAQRVAGSFRRAPKFRHYLLEACTALDAEAVGVLRGYGGYGSAARGLDAMQHSSSVGGDSVATGFYGW